VGGTSDGVVLLTLIYNITTVLSSSLIPKIDIDIYVD